MKIVRSGWTYSYSWSLVFAIDPPRYLTLPCSCSCSCCFSYSHSLVSLPPTVLGEAATAPAASTAPRPPASTACPEATKVMVVHVIRRIEERNLSAPEPTRGHGRRPEPRCGRCAEAYGHARAAVFVLYTLKSLGSGGTSRSEPRAADVC